MVPPRDVLLGSLASFDARRGAIETDWATLSDLAEGNGLAPLASYNLEYRMGGAGAPQEVRDRLMALYQGTLNDNVFKLVTLKRTLAETPGLPVMLLDAAAVADCAYPHVAFRPIPELILGVRSDDGGSRLEAAMARGGMKPDRAVPNVFTDGRARFIFTSPLSPGGAGDAGVWDRSLAAAAYGEGVRRPSIEDAILLAVVSMAGQGYSIPLIQFVDLRELFKGASATGAVYGGPPDAGILQRRAEEWGTTRALYATLSLLAALFPAERTALASFHPSPFGRSLLDRWVVRPVLERAGSLDAKPLSRLARAALAG